MEFLRDIYIPIFGCSCVIQYFYKKNNWLKKICLFLIFCYFIPVLNSAFNLFSSSDYTRWLYGMALLFSLITALTLENAENHEQLLNKRILWWVTFIAAAILLIPSAVYILYHFGISIINRFASVCATEYFMGYPALIVMLILTLANYIGLWYIVLKKKNRIKHICYIVILASATNYLVYNSINYDLHATNYSNAYYYQKSILDGVENTSQFFEYRIDYPGQIANYSLFKNMPAVNYYNSLQNAKSSLFAEATGIGENRMDTILILPDTGREYIDSLLSVKYYYDYDNNSTIPSGFNYVKTENGVNIYENEYYIPMGFVYDEYCLEEQLSGQTPEVRVQAMLNSLVIDKSDENLVSQYLTKTTDYQSSEPLTTLSQQRRQSACSYFSGSSSGFDAKIHLDAENIVFFSVPNDSGWKITVNGKPAKLIEVNYGLIGICCSEGDNIISATYHTKGLLPGITCSAMSACLWIVLEIAKRTKMRRYKCYQ